MTNIILNKKKLKMKKDALEYVDFDLEKKNDPKYKTELCKSFMETKFCVYGNKCRFAHGRHELCEKNEKQNKYKVKNCSSFKDFGFCLYGARCNFIHDTRDLKTMDRSFFTLNLLKKVKSLNENSEDFSYTKRLKAFQNIKLTKQTPERLTNNFKINNQNLFDYNCNFKKECLNYTNSYQYSPLALYSN